MNHTPDFVAGMTVNERLVHFGLLEAFDAAVRSKQLSSVVQVLIQAQLSEAQARQTAKAVLAAPQRYGF